MIIDFQQSSSGEETMQFLNCQIPFPRGEGLFIVPCSCGSGKTTMIARISESHWKEGLLIVVPTIDAANELEAKLPISSWATIGRRVLNLNCQNADAIDLYTSGPTVLQSYPIVIVTSARLIIDPHELLTGYNGGMRTVLIDEMINFYPKPFEIPKPLYDIVTYWTKDEPSDLSLVVDQADEWYQCRYESFNTLRFVYDHGNMRLFTAKTELCRYKEDFILKHICKEGLSPISQTIARLAETTKVMLFDGTADCIFKADDSRMLPVIGSRYNSDIQFIQFDLPFKRKNKDGWSTELLETQGKAFFDQIAVLTKSEKVLVVTWKSLDVFPFNDGNADVFERTDKVQHDLPLLLEQALINHGAVSCNLSVIYRGSGQDRGSNEFRDYSVIVFLGEWRIPDGIVKDINRMFDANCSFFDYKKALMIQTICRLKIRQHKAFPIKVYFSSDINYELMFAVQEYFKANSPNTCKIDGILKPCPSKSKTDKGFLLDLVILNRYDNHLLSSYQNGNAYSFTIKLNEIESLLPRDKKGKDRYQPLIKWLKSIKITMTIE